MTGANRGLGLAFAKVLVEREAAKVYAAARNPEAVTLMGIVPLKLDVTSDEDAVAAARVAGNINLLINNTGIARHLTRLVGRQRAMEVVLSGDDDYEENTHRCSTRR